MANSVVTAKDYQEHLKKLRDGIERKHGKSLKTLYEERQKRLWDAIELKEPDRVPAILGGSYIACKYAGLPFSTVYYEPIAWKKAYTQMISDYEPDTWGTTAASSGTVLDALEAKNSLWPGGTLPPDAAQQSIDGEYLKEDEYDLFLEDTTDFILRRYIPRVYGAMAPLASLPALGDRYMGLPAIAAIFDTPEYRKAARALLKAGKAQKKWSRDMGNFSKDMNSLGFPQLSQGGGGAGGPVFDIMANTYRGWLGIVKDMFRRPEKLIAAMEKINEKQIARATPADPNKKGPQIGGGGAIHRGSDRFLSKQQWETFYWPTWKKSLQVSIDLGYIPFVFAEGFCENRLEYFLDFPKGSLMFRFTDTDMFKAKEVLGDRFCIMGSVPLTLLQMGSTQDVDEYCKKLIQGCGKNGGYILRTDTDFIQDAKLENIRAMMDAVNKYGWYAK